MEKIFLWVTRSFFFKGIIFIHRVRWLFFGSFIVPFVIDEKVLTFSFCSYSLIRCVQIKRVKKSLVVWLIDRSFSSAWSSLNFLSSEHRSIVASDLAFWAKINILMRCSLSKRRNRIYTNNDFTQSHCSCFSDCLFVFRRVRCRQSWTDQLSCEYK